MIKATTIKKSSGQEYEVLDADVYQIQIVDVNEKEGLKYLSQDKVLQYMFKAVVVEGDNIDKPLFFFTSQSWFEGGEGSNPSKLFLLFKNVYAFYEKDKDVKEIEEITDIEINGLVGKQVRVSVAITEKGRNKVTSFLPIKKVIPYKQNENVTMEEVPF